MNKHIPVITELGIIDGRDSIFLDSVEQRFSPNQLKFIGEINGELCENNHLGYEWYPYELKFNSVQAYDNGVFGE
ncbi:hypothetical protein [Mechercharimyces sp. CAU 1602]|uniref:hypothetical protein n=1 Tax=Mechercharimyces sp. CAU 1602 TaxID=2973933 RepID=UPI0021629CA7|nr:hypothetical protein [Mechercharimyces sp. CAU 1602]MCS1350877.1 hypothetical protein [Mechercharimyces sp. CAU 1602]